jgi:hypothetical protein
MKTALLALLVLASSACLMETDADVDAELHAEPLTFTFINSNNGQSLNDPSCKLAFLRGYVMQECPAANCWSCSGDTCTHATRPARTWVAKSCVDLSAPGERRCELRVREGSIDMMRGYMFYTTTCQHAPLPKASLLYATPGATTAPTQRVLNQPTNRLETF